MEKKQNSIDQLELDLEIWFTLSGMHFPIEIKNSIQRAKAMHKEEIVDAYNESFRLRDKPYSTAVKYYNEKFGGKNE